MIEFWICHTVFNSPEPCAQFLPILSETWRWSSLYEKRITLHPSVLEGGSGWLKLIGVNFLVPNSLPSVFVSSVDTKKRGLLFPKDAQTFSPYVARKVLKCSLSVCWVLLSGSQHRPGTQWPARNCQAQRVWAWGCAASFASLQLFKMPHHKKKLGLVPPPPLIWGNKFGRGQRLRPLAPI